MEQFYRQRLRPDLPAQLAPSDPDSKANEETQAEF